MRNALSTFTGTEQWHYNPLYPAMKYTDGVKYFAENAGNGAYWFLDIMGTEVMDIHKRGEEFIAVTLDAKDGEAKLSCTDGNDTELWHRDIEYTDCPDGKWQFYLTNNVLLLPSEY
jgi:hypothetical protein